MTAIEHLPPRTAYDLGRFTGRVDTLDQVQAKLVSWFDEASSYERRSNHVAVAMLTDWIADQLPAIKAERDQVKAAVGAAP